MATVFIWFLFAVIASCFVIFISIKYIVWCNNRIKRFYYSKEFVDSLKGDRVIGILGALANLFFLVVIIVSVLTL